MRAIRGSFFIAITLMLSGQVFAQDDKAEDLPDTPAIKACLAAKANIEKLNKEVDEIFAKAKTLTRSDVEELQKLQVSFDKNYKQKAKTLSDLRGTSLTALKDAPKSATIGKIVMQIAMADLQSDKYAAAYSALKLLASSGNPTEGVNDAAAFAAFASSDFVAAKKYLAVVTENKEPARLSGRLTAESLDAHIEDWKKEAVIRAAEAAKNDLPRVKFETTEGNIVIELYENEAPQAVGNFVSLIEKKYYDGLVFHRVLPGFMAQGGCPDGRGTGGPGYNIYCECHKEGYRKHFSGTLSMAHAGKDTGGSQFFLTFLPTPHLDGRHTAFGRVIEGMDVLAKLKRVNPQRPSGESPSKIRTATVVRKRDHKYAPTKVE